MPDLISSQVTFQIQFGGLNTMAPASMVYPDALQASNVSWGRAGELLKTNGTTTYNATAMSTKAVITGIFQFNRRDTTTRYTIVLDKDRLWVVPTSGAWTALTASMGATITDYGDAAVFNNELVVTNGVTAPQVTDGTAAGTGALSARVWQTKTSDLAATAGWGAGMWGEDGYTLYRTSVDQSGVATGSGMSAYDTIGDAWAVRNTSVTGKMRAPTFSAFGSLYLVSGVNGAGTQSGTGERYSYVNDSWAAITSPSTNKIDVAGMASPVNGYIPVGSTTGGAANVVATNFQYDPVTDSWSSKSAFATARYRAMGAAIGSYFIVSSGTDITPSMLTSTETYNPFTDTVGSGTAITNARGHGGSVGGEGEQKCYDVGGATTTALNDTSTNMQSYDSTTNAWTQEAVVPASLRQSACGEANYGVYVSAGYGSGGTSVRTLYRFNISPSAPTAFYVESARGYLLLARTSSFPSRVFYSLPGNARVWDAESWFDVSPDDGDWITGMFVFDGRLYVSKTDTIYQIPFSVLDPEEGDEQIVPLENVKGTVSNRSIVVTDVGVFYLAEDGFRVFDGARSVKISEKIQPTIDGYVQSRLKYTAGLWNRSKDELWWSMTTTGTTHDIILRYNYHHQKWSTLSVAAESLATVEDANDIDQLLFGNADTSDGKLYVADTGSTFNTAAISATWQSGWFSPVSGLNQFTPKNLIGWATRSGNWNLTVATRARYGTSNLTNDSVNLLSGTYPDVYFQDAADNRFRIHLGSGDQDLTGHAHSIILSNASASQPFTVHGLIMTGDHSVAGGSFPT